MPGSSLGGAFEDEIGLVKTIEHGLTVGLESSREQVVQISLVAEVDSGDGHRASITCLEVA